MSYAVNDQVKYWRHVRNNLYDILPAKVVEIPPGRACLQQEVKIQYEHNGLIKARYVKLDRLEKVKDHAG